MRGTKVPSILLTERDLHLFREASEVAKIIDREMAQEICGFPSVNRANERLLQLVRSGYLRRYFVGTEAGGRKSLYTLSPKAAATILSASNWRFKRPENVLLCGDTFTEHQSAINWVWIAAKYRALPNAEFRRWVSFPEPLSKNIPLVPMDISN